MSSSVLSSIRSHLWWRSAKSLRSADPDAAARKFVLAVTASPSNETRARRAVRMLVADGHLAEARIISRVQMQDDPVAYWRHFDSFLRETRSAEDRAPSDARRPKIVLLNDTDARLNIGCRLTSQGLKGALRKALPGSQIESHGFRFPAFRDATVDSATPIEPRVTLGYGARALDALHAADLVVLQPEGSLDDSTSLEGLRTFFAPVLLAHRLGKPTVIVNGTIPAYDDERADLLLEMFSRLPAVAARDELSASRYRIEFLPDAALLYPPPAPARERDGCLITTGARNTARQDEEIIRAALEVCSATGLRPIVLTHAAERFEAFEPAIRAMDGVFAETASLEVAATTLSGCRLHVGARYHMALFCHVLRVPSLLFDVATHKNRWLDAFSPLITLVAPGPSLVPAARDMLQADRVPDESADDLGRAYEDFLHQAAGRAGA